MALFTASDFGHALDAGSGRLIPTMAVDQYAAQLGQWYGLSDSELKRKSHGTPYIAMLSNNSLILIYFTFKVMFKFNNKSYLTSRRA
ncbi:MAG: hypothetical protein ACI8QT_001631 [Halioglobus sp.]